MKRSVIFLTICTALGVACWVAWQTLADRGSKPIEATLNDGDREAALSPEPLSPGVAGLISPETLALRDRLAFLSTLGFKLPHQDRMAILDWLENASPPGLSNDDWFTLANDTMQALRNQQPPTAEFTDRMIRMWHDRTLDPTMRDYALQQLREWVADGDTRTQHETRPEKLALIRQTFLDATTPGHPDCDPLSTTTGTALLALDEWSHDSAPEGVRIPAEEVGSLLLAHAENPAAHRGVRATALQLCARRGLVSALPPARRLAKDTSEEAILRLAAISLLGSIGNSEDRLLLENLSSTSQLDPLILGAVASALRESTSKNP